jgi:hypothetical protein
MKLEDLVIRKRSVSRIGCVLATQWMALVPAVLADDSAWTVLGIQDTGTSRDYSLVAAMSDAGDIYSVTYCPSPTFKFGDSSRISTCITKADTSGRQVFATLIGGVASVYRLVLDQADGRISWGTPIHCRGCRVPREHTSPAPQAHTIIGLSASSVAPTGNLSFAPSLMFKLTEAPPLPHSLSTRLGIVTSRARAHRALIFAWRN